MMYGGQADRQKDLKLNNIKDGRTNGEIKTDEQTNKTISLQRSDQVHFLV